MKDYLTVNVRNLDFQQVITFFTVVECENFTRAADSLNMTQAAVSRIIANLEKETHLILFVRKVRGAIPTPAGRILYKEWKEALRYFEKGYLDAYRAQLGYIRDLNLGCVDMNQDLSHHIKMMDWFEHTFPDNHLKIDYDATEVLRDGLVSRKFDIVFVSLFEAAYLETVGIRCDLLVRKNCNLFVHKTHPLYNKEHITPEDLREKSITFFGSTHILASPLMQMFCETYGVEGKDICLEADYKKAVVLFARQTGLFFSEGIFEQNQFREARRLPLDGITSGLVLAWSNQDNSLPIKEITRYVKMVTGYKMPGA